VQRHPANRVEVQSLSTRRTRGTSRSDRAQGDKAAEGDVVLSLRCARQTDERSFRRAWTSRERIRVDDFRLLAANFSDDWYMGQLQVATRSRFRD
jgi:hypothetical protein